MVEGDGIHPNRYSLAGRHHRSSSCVRHLRGFRADDLTSGGAALTGRSRALRAFINRTAFDRIDDEILAFLLIRQVLNADHLRMRVCHRGSHSPVGNGSFGPGMFLIADAN